MSYSRSFLPRPCRTCLPLLCSSRRRELSKDFSSLSLWTGWGGGGKLLDEFNGYMRSASESYGNEWVSLRDDKCVLFFFASQQFTSTQASTHTHTSRWCSWKMFISCSTWEKILICFKGGEEIVAELLMLSTFHRFFCCCSSLSFSALLCKRLEKWKLQKMLSFLTRSLQLAG